MEYFKKRFGLYILLFIVLILVLINYKPGTFLTGWDTLHPEFDFGLNLKRLIAGVWREEQGLGAVSGHSHMADLPRVFILWLFSFIFPVSFLRYLYIFLCLLFGPLGIYFLIYYLIKKYKSITETFNETIALLTGLFYLFNLGTVQQFFVPFEMFTTQYAVLPWIILSSFMYLEKPNRKNLLFFAFITLLSTPQAYAAHLWYAFFVIYFFFLVLYIILFKSWQGIKIASTLVILTLLINSFWLIPNFYFIKTSSRIPIEAKQTRLFSQEYGLRNREHGYIKDVALIKGFYFNWSIFDFEKQRVDYLMNDWRKHSDNTFISILGYLFFATVVVGLFVSIKKRFYKLIALSPFLFISLAFLLNHTFPFEQILDFMVQFPIFDQGLRFVFTKFSIFLIFAYSIYFSHFLLLIFNLVHSIKWRNLISGFVALLLVIYAFPMIKGQLISEKMKIKIPQEYFRFWEFMKNQDKGSVLSLPLHTFSGWQYYNWGYQGSGFIWFGLKQSILDRDFDRWSIQNEQAYREFRYALYARNPDFFFKNLEKFNIKYILWDRSNITTIIKNRPQIIYNRENDLLLSELVNRGKIQHLTSLNNLIIFKVNLTDGSLSSISNLPEVNPEYRWTYLDQAYNKFGSYFTFPNQKLSDQQGYYFPYRNILNFDDRLKEEYLYKIKNASPSGELIFLDAQNIISKNEISPQVKLLKSSEGKIIQFRSKNDFNGIGLNFHSLTHNRGYILVLKTKNIKGLPLRICLRNLYSSLCDIYDEVIKNKDFALDYYFVPPSEGAIGYDLFVDNISYGDYETINELKEISLIPISTNILDIYETDETINNKSTFVLNKSFNSGWLAYQIKNDPSNVKMWIRKVLPFIYGKRLNDHVLVNNWANGWKISSELVKTSQKLDETSLSQTRSEQIITIIFWPQYLEYLGFVLLIISFLYILKQNKTS